MTSESERGVKDWMTSVVKASGGRIKESDVFSSIVTKNYLEDPRCALELGLAILMDKPIFLIADKTQKLPKALIRAAQVVEYADLDDKDDLYRASQTLARFAEKLEHG